VYLCLLCCLYFGAQVSYAAPAGVENPARAKVNYMLNCQGCHGPDGAGTADGAVPAMKDFVGKFLSVDGGRAFLVRVPGSANSALTDTALAEVLNWMLWELSSTQIPAQFSPYTAAEVGPLRARPLQDVAGVRASLVAKMGLL
jgi:mono/diheme cytochrome c family protein